MDGQAGSCRMRDSGPQVFLPGHQADAGDAPRLDPGKIHENWRGAGRVMVQEIGHGQAGNLVRSRPPGGTRDAGHPAENPAERHPPQSGDGGKGAAGVAHGHAFTVDQDDKAGTLSRNGGNSPSWRKRTLRRRPRSGKQPVSIQLTL